MGPCMTAFARGGDKREHKLHDGDILDDSDSRNTNGLSWIPAGGGTGEGEK